MLYWSTIFVISSVFDILILSKLGYSTGCFLCKIVADNFDFSSDFYAPDFLRFAWSKILSQSQFQATELNWRQFNTKSQTKSAPKVVPFFTLKLNSGIC